MSEYRDDFDTSSYELDDVIEKAYDALVEYFQDLTRRYSGDELVAKHLATCAS